jgi:ABC-2 type transport system ATP-binding protein
MSGAPAVQARGLAFAYGERAALRGLDFTVAAGTAHGFLGPNGSGKSTLFKLLSTLVPLQRGEVSLLGFDLRRQVPGLRRQLGVVFQSPALDKQLTVRENLRHAGHLYGLAGLALARRSDELLQHADLSERARDRVGELSGGLRRRVEICKALLHRPRLLLLDEASTGLDPAARIELWRLLRREQGLTVLFTTHLLDEAAGADMLTLLDDGAIAAAGSPADLMREVGGQVLKVEAHDAAALAQRLEAACGRPPRLVDGVLRFEGAGVHELVPRIVAGFGASVTRISLAHPSLADVFLHVTGKRFVDREPPPAVRTERRRR